MRHHFLTAACFVVLACGDDEGTPDTKTRDSAVADASADARADGSTSNRNDAGLSTNDRDAATSSTDAAVEQIAVDRVLPEIAPSSNKPTVATGVSDAVATCASSELSCNGACISASTPESADKNGCRLIDGSFYKVDLFVDGDVLYAAGERNPSTNAEQGVYRIGLGGEATKLLAKVDEARVLGVHEDKLIVLGEGGCDGPGRLTKCLKTLPTAGGEPTPLFAGLNDTTPAIAGGKAVYYEPVETSIATVYERALFDGAPVARFATAQPAGLGPLKTNGSYAFFSRSEGGDDVHLLTQLGVAGTTVQLAKDFVAPFTDEFFAGDYLYMVRRILNEGAHYQRLKLGEQTGEELAELPLVPVNVAVAGDSIFFESLSETMADRIYRMPIEGGAITPVATFERSSVEKRWVAIGNSLYVVALAGSGSSIVRIALP